MWSLSFTHHKMIKRLIENFIVSAQGKIVRGFQPKSLGLCCCTQPTRRRPEVHDLVRTSILKIRPCFPHPVALRTSAHSRTWALLHRENMQNFKHTLEEKVPDPEERHTGTCDPMETPLWYALQMGTVIWSHQRYVFNVFLNSFSIDSELLLTQIPHLYCTLMQNFT